jgi:hypothetical protein
VRDSRRRLINIIPAEDGGFSPGPDSDAVCRSAGHVVQMTTRRCGSDDDVRLFSSMNLSCRRRCRWPPPPERGRMKPISCEFAKLPCRRLHRIRPRNVHTYIHTYTCTSWIRHAIWYFSKEINSNAVCADFDAVVHASGTN